MIDWSSVLFNSSWILGASILLAGLSYHHWLAPLEKRSLREQLSQQSFLKLFWLSLIFVSIGLAGTSRRAWETGIWMIFLLFSVVNALNIYRSSKDN